MIPFERYFSELSENPTIIIFDLGSTEFKLWQLHGGGGGVVEHLSTAITSVQLIHCQKF